MGKCLPKCGFADRLLGEVFNLFGLLFTRGFARMSCQELRSLGSSPSSPSQELRLTEVSPARCWEVSAPSLGADMGAGEPQMDEGARRRCPGGGFAQKEGEAMACWGGWAGVKLLELSPVTMQSHQHPDTTEDNTFGKANPSLLEGKTATERKAGKRGGRKAKS